MPEFEAILFDFDGVFLDSEPVHCACWAELLAPLGIALNWEYYRQYGVGVDDREMLRMVAARSDPPRKWEELWALYPAKKKLFQARMAQSPPFDPSLDGFLSGLHGVYKLAVVSSSSTTEIALILAAGGIVNGAGLAAALGRPTPGRTHGAGGGRLGTGHGQWTRRRIRGAGRERARQSPRTCARQARNVTPAILSPVGLSGLEQAGGKTASATARPCNLT